MRNLVAYNSDAIEERLTAGLKISDIWKEVQDAVKESKSDFIGSYEGFRRAVGIAGIKKKKPLKKFGRNKLESKKKKSLDELLAEPINIDELF